MSLADRLAVQCGMEGIGPTGTAEPPLPLGEGWGEGVESFGLIGAAVPDFVVSFCIGESLGPSALTRPSATLSPRERGIIGRSASDNSRSRSGE